MYLLTCVLFGQPIGSGLTRAVAQSAKAFAPQKLTPSETEILALFLKRGNLRPVAEELGVGLNTVRSQKASVMRKLGVQSPVQLTLEAVRRGLIEVDESITTTPKGTPTMKKTVRLLSKAWQPLLLLGLTSVVCFAQSSPFGTASTGIATEVVAIAKWIGIIIAVISGLSMAGGGGHGSHIGAKMTGLLVGLVLALFANPIVTWVSSL